MADNRREWVRWHSSMTPNQPPQRNQVPDLSPSTSAHSTPSTPSTRSPATPSSHASQYSHRSPPQISSPPSGSGGNRRTGTFAPAPSMPNLRGQYGTNIATSSPAPSFDNRYATPNALAQSQSRIDLRSGWQQSKEQWDALGRGPRGNYGGGNYGGGRPSASAPTTPSASPMNPNFRPSTDSSSPVPSGGLYTPSNSYSRHRPQPPPPRGQSDSFTSSSSSPPGPSRTTDSNAAQNFSTQTKHQYSSTAARAARAAYATPSRSSATSNIHAAANYTAASRGHKRCYESTSSSASSSSSSFAAAAYQAGPPGRSMAPPPSPHGGSRPGPTPSGSFGSAASPSRGPPGLAGGGKKVRRDSAESLYDGRVDCMVFAWRGGVGIPKPSYEDPDQMSE